ncbi:CobD/CbiB family protein [Chitinasiproducens palmae]|uniref:Cobalamin biosynthesis protein CobD n=1 Tax=Chitinasiproducens palmae TaxID=1770053 RepID=A0A1H2PWH8_9BURK|nr:CobD/CbiB family protein [Chitinasiproducens palmae]SDV50902.1 adenosylcobinamide-phosphate synthase [Chitinasiproducens palmae]
MTFLSVLLALIIEQFRALSARNPIALTLASHARAAHQRLDAGRTRHGALAWLAVVLPWTLAVGLIYVLLLEVHVVLAFAWNVVVLYFTLGFRQFSHYFTDIHLALNADDVGQAREILAEWTGMTTDDMPVEEIVRHTLRYAVVQSHRHVFGVFFWFIVPIGPAGAVLYRIAEYLSREWIDVSDDPDAAFPRFAGRIFYLIDWLPARLTALGFAIVGNFEDAVHAWRQAARQLPQSNDGVLLAAGGGGLGVRLATPIAEPDSLDALSGDVTVELDGQCTPRTLQSAVGMVWRAVILWMILLLMLSAALWFG